ncbi:zeatin o-glucosyltransferase, partial [Phtheirospermum japonicum]
PLWFEFLHREYYDGSADCGLTVAFGSADECCVGDRDTETRAGREGMDGDSEGADY